MHFLVYLGAELQLANQRPRPSLADLGPLTGPGAEDSEHSKCLLELSGGSSPRGDFLESEGTLEQLAFGFSLPRLCECA